MPGPSTVLSPLKPKNCPRLPSGQNGSFSAVQGVDGGPGMVNVELLDVADLAQTCDLGVDALKSSQRR